MDGVQVLETQNVWLLGTLWRKWMQSIHAWDGEDYEEYWTKLLERLPQAKIYLVAEDGESCGLISACLIEDLMGEKVGYVLHLFLDLAHRSRLDLFWTLIRQVQGFFQERDCSRILMEIDPALEGMDRLLECLKRRGYKQKHVLYERKGSAVW